MKLVIPALRRIAEAARKYAYPGTELADAYDELAEAERDSEKRHLAALASKGVDCKACGRRFVPTPDGDGAACSIGCQFALREDKRRG